MSGIALATTLTTYGNTADIDPVPSMQMAVFEFAFLISGCTFKL
jgi:hypothetical protein